MIGKGWTPAAELIVGDSLLVQSGETAVITGIECELLQTPIKVFNLEVEDWHTYYVSRDGILVHNACWRGLNDGGKIPSIITIENKAHKAINASDVTSK